MSPSSVVLLSSSSSNPIQFSSVIPILKNRTKPKFKFKLECNQKIQLPKLTITTGTVFCSSSSSPSSVTSGGDNNGCQRGSYNYGGWDDFGPSNSLSTKHGVASLWNWLENWENDREKVSNQVGILCDLVLKFLSLDKSAQTKFLRLMQNDTSFSEFLQTDRKFNRNPQSEKFNLYTQIWRKVFEEGDEDVASIGRNPELENAVSQSPSVVVGDRADDINLAGSNKTSDLGKEDVTTNGSVEIAEMMDSSAPGIRRVHGISQESSIGCSSVTQLGQGQDESKKRKSQNNKQLSDNNGYVLEHLGGNKGLGVDSEQNTRDSRGIFNQSVRQVDEENGEKNSKGLDVLQNYTRKKAQTSTNHVDVPPWKSREAEQRVENPLTSSAVENQEAVKEQELFETCKSSLICPDQSNIFQTSLPISESSGFEKPKISIQGNRYENCVNSNDRNGKQESIAEKGYSMDNKKSDFHCQAEFDRIKSKSEHSESTESENVFSKENFQMCLDKGETLLKEAKNILRGKTDLSDAERMLSEAADLFSTASAIDPSSLVAVGQLGNTLLVHGELKLKLSQELMSWLQVQDDSLSSDEVQKYQPDELILAMTERENVAATLHEFCEECEKLLVEAGRKYRTALMLDRYDVRSLYNWGLALCFRAQLMTGGNKTALPDADKIYLAAIDKFEAMMRISQIYAPDALFSWGLAMRNRSRMRTMWSKERRRLLQQARQLFQDALKFKPNHAQAKRAFISCIHELEELEFVLLKNQRQGRIRSKTSWNVD